MWDIYSINLCRSSNIANLHWKARSAIVFHHMSCRDVSRQKTPVHCQCPLVLIFQKVSFHPDFPHPPPQQSSCGPNNEYEDLPDQESQGIIQQNPQVLFIHFPSWHSVSMSLSFLQYCLSAFHWNLCYATLAPLSSTIILRLKAHWKKSSSREGPECLPGVSSK